MAVGSTDAQGGDSLGREQPGVRGQRGREIEPPLAARGSIDNHGDNWDVPAERKQAVAMWLMVTVIAPDPT